MMPTRKMTKPIEAAVRERVKNVEMKNDKGTNDTANKKNNTMYKPASFLQKKSNPKINDERMSMPAEIVLRMMLTTAKLSQ